MIFYNPCKKHKGSSEEDFRIFAKKMTELTLMNKVDPGGPGQIRELTL